MKKDLIDEIRELIKIEGDVEKTTDYNRHAHSIFYDNSSMEEKFDAALLSERTNRPGFLEFWNFYWLMEGMREVIEKNQKKPIGTVYILACEQTGRIKIGHTTKQVNKRVNAIKGMSGSNLNIAVYFEAPKAMESKIHKLLHEHRLHGEWFSPNISDWLINCIKECVKSELHYNDIFQSINKSFLSFNQL